MGAVTLARSRWRVGRCDEPDLACSCCWFERCPGFPGSAGQWVPAQAHLFRVFGQLGAVIPLPLAEGELGYSCGNDG